MLEYRAASGSRKSIRRQITIVDDDDACRRSIQLLLHWRGFEVRAFDCAAPVLVDQQHDDMSWLIVDLRLPDASGLSLLGTLRARGWRGQAVLITGFPQDGLADAAAEHDCHVVLEKPLRGDDLLIALGDRFDQGD